jgi:hypothetical protein
MSRRVLRNRRWFNGSRRETAADGTLAAGDLGELTANGIQSHPTDGAAIDNVLVIEDARGRGTVAGDNYDTEETVPYLNCNAGDLVTLRLADGESVTGPDGGDPTQLVSNGDGTVRAFDGAGGDTEEDVVAVADETLNNTSGSPSLLDAEVTR